MSIELTDSPNSNVSIEDINSDLQYSSMKNNGEIESSDELQCDTNESDNSDFRNEIINNTEIESDLDKMIQNDLKAEPSSACINALMLPCETDESNYEEVNIYDINADKDDNQENDDFASNLTNTADKIESLNESDFSEDCGSSGTTESCSEEEIVSTNAKEEQNILLNNISTLVNGGLRKSISKKENKTKQFVTSFNFDDGSVIYINKKYWHQPIVIELGNIIDAFLNKVRLKPELSQMISKTAAKDDALLVKEKMIQNLTKNYKVMEKQNLEMKLKLKQMEDSLRFHDESAKRTIARLQKESELKLNEMAKKCGVAESEKQSSVMNFARREKEVLDLRKQKENADQFARAAGRDKEKTLNQLKQMKIDLTKMRNILEKRESENSVQTKEFEKMKEEINSQAIKVRWAQNKLKSEVDSHKETKERCEKMVFEIQQAKEETEQIRKNCQDMIKTYQESEEIKSNALDIELKEKKDYIETLEHDLTKLNSTLTEKNEKLTELQEAQNKLLEENKSIRKQLDDLKQTTSENKHKMHEYYEILNKQKATAIQMNEKMQNIFDLQAKIEDLNITIRNLNEALHDAVLQRDAALKDVTCKEQKEQELLEFTEKVSSKNTELNVKLEEVTSKVTLQNLELLDYKEKITSLTALLEELTSTKEKDTQTFLKNEATLNSRLEEKEQTICQLLLQLEELKDEMRTVKRKNAASLKDLTRQLNQIKRKAENAENVSANSVSNNTNHSADGGSMGSRTSSVTSLDKIQSAYVADSHENAQCEHISVPETAVTGPDSLGRQILIERIVRLQQIHAKKNEKIDFLSEHIQQLVTALQKKQRLIQHYIMREESGALAPPRERHDQKRHGLTLDLSIEINQKMQSVLEDTLLKNITLKESLETLGKEVQRLQQNPSDVT